MSGGSECLLGIRGKLVSFEKQFLCLCSRLFAGTHEAIPEGLHLLG